MQFCVIYVIIMMYKYVLCEYYNRSFMMYVLYAVKYITKNIYPDLIYIFLYHWFYTYSTKCKTPSRNLPIYNVVIVQVLQPQDDAGSIKYGAGFGEDIVVDVHHEVTSTRVLHHKTYVLLTIQQINTVQLVLSIIQYNLCYP